MVISCKRLIYNLYWWCKITYAWSMSIYKLFCECMECWESITFIAVHIVFIKCTLNIKMVLWQHIDNERRLLIGCVLYCKSCFNVFQCQIQIVNANCSMYFLISYGVTAVMQLTSIYVRVQIVNASMFYILSYITWSYSSIAISLKLRSSWVKEQ